MHQNARYVLPCILLSNLGIINYVTFSIDFNQLAENGLTKFHGI